MAKDGVDRLVDLWLTDPAFRSAMQNDPEGAVRGSGIILDASEWATVRNIVMSSSDEELRARASKGTSWN